MNYFQTGYYLTTNHYYSGPNGNNWSRMATISSCGRIAAGTQRRAQWNLEVMGVINLQMFIDMVTYTSPKSQQSYGIDLCIIQADWLTPDRFEYAQWTGLSVHKGAWRAE